MSDETGVNDDAQCSAAVVVVVQGPVAAATGEAAELPEGVVPGGHFTAEMYTTENRALNIPHLQSPYP